MESQRNGIVPPEVIFHILCFMSPRDVIRARLVSREFHDIAHGFAIWRALYTNARLPRPPGPLPSQSIQFLERTLVESERLTDSWTTQPIEDISGVVIRRSMTSFQSISPTFMFGKWLLWLESGGTHTFRVTSRFFAQDLDSTEGRHTVWEFDSDVSIESWEACPVVSSSGLLIHVVFVIWDQLDKESWKLLEFRANGDALHHALTSDVPTRNLGRPAHIAGGPSQFSYIRGQELIFDAETRSFYRFPEFQSALVEVSSDPDSHYLSHNCEVVLSKTHIISLARYIDRTGSSPKTQVLIQAFTVPAIPCIDANGTSVLHLSHEGVTPGHIGTLNLIRNSIMNPVACTTIRLLHQTYRHNQLDMSCIDLTLPGHSDIILPMTIDVRKIAHSDCIPDASVRPHHCHIAASDDGHVRGLCQFSNSPSIFGNPVTTLLVMRFTIDASGDECVADLGEISLPQWKNLDEPSWDRKRFHFYDCVRGRMCYDRIGIVYAWPDHDDVAAVIDIK